MIFQILCVQHTFFIDGLIKFECPISDTRNFVINIFKIYSRSNLLMHNCEYNSCITKFVWVKYFFKRILTKSSFNLISFQVFISVFDFEFQFVTSADQSLYMQRSHMTLQSVVFSIFLRFFLFQLLQPLNWFIILLFLHFPPAL